MGYIEKYSWSCCAILWVTVVLERTIVSGSDCHFDNLSRSNHQRQVVSCFSAECTTVPL